MRASAAVLLAAIAITGCATQRQLTPDEVVQLEPVVCQGEQQCKAMWQSAQLWIAQNAAMKLQLVTDVVLQTYNDPSPSGTRLSYTVVKEPLGGDAYQIRAVVSCPNPFACTMPPQIARATLHRHIRETPK